LARIKKDFKYRFDKDVKRAVFITTGPGKITRNVEIEYKDAEILEIKQISAPNDVKDKYPIQYNGDSYYFDTIFKLAKKEGYQVAGDIVKKKLFMQKVSGTMKYIRNEILPDASEWDGSAKRYFATRLKHNSPDDNSPKNGVIYKDNIALPYSPYPQWENVPCGKIESSIAFISKAAFNPKSKYSADYLSMQVESVMRELIIPDKEDSALERVIKESDVLFCPDALEYFALFGSEAKMNAIYHNSKNEPGSLEYQIAEPVSLKTNRYIIRKLKRMFFNIRQRIFSAIGQSAVIMKKFIKLSILWFRILIFMTLKNIKDLVYKIVRF